MCRGVWPWTKCLAGFVMSGGCDPHPVRLCVCERLRVTDGTVSCWTVCRSAYAGSWDRAGVCSSLPSSGAGPCVVLSTTSPVPVCLCPLEVRLQIAGGGSGGRASERSRRWWGRPHGGGERDFTFKVCFFHLKIQIKGLCLPDLKPRSKLRCLRISKVRTMSRLTLFKPDRKTSHRYALHFWVVVHSRHSQGGQPRTGTTGGLSPTELRRIAFLICVSFCYCLASKHTRQGIQPQILIDLA